MKNLEAYFGVLHILMTEYWFRESSSENYHCYRRRGTL